MTTPTHTTERVACITGAASGIGASIARRLAEDGLHVALNDLPDQREALDDLAAEVQSRGVRATVVPGDISEAGGPDDVVARLVSELGQLDVMVSNAGIAEVKPLLEVSAEDWDRMLGINLRGMFLTYTAAARQMIEQGRGGKIIGAASLVAHRPFPMLGHYVASKYGVRGLTQNAAAEWAKHGITVNAYCPGIVDTPMWDLIDERLAEEEGLEPGEAKQKYTEQMISLGRMQRPEDVVGFVSYLASPDSDYMTGQSVIVDGGIHFV
ncbi:SDR family oxidoreductase [Egibacter rhizosphaerae]|uniref:SDR family oxidoreductase n=1 Tax=Egibacter rhizosphaerae TaxID=1670831 RepID=A0A411YB82_9ACTN|nr:SDR family oxidoreductase [Egibacter rhizosphaerae]QBI18464.1 SDR family oxidoreductase [Egibacter rhizosphaerae]